MEYKNTQLKKLLFAVICMVSINLFSQNYVPFSGPGRLTPIPFNESLKGDMLLIGNSVLNRSTTTDGPNVPYNGTAGNGSFDMQNIDIDGDASTFNSSSANLTIPAINNDCYQIKFAMLYWGGLYYTSQGFSNFGNVKFKLPGSSSYSNLSGTVIYDAPYAIAGINNYVAFFDVTTMLQGLANANGTYTVADVKCGLGSAVAGGWSLFVVYEDPLATAKNITLFDGFSSISGSNTLNIPITGFNSIPVGPVRAQLAFAAIEGDNDITGDRLRINGVNMSTPLRPANNFFNSTINDVNGAFTNRNLNSSNLLGYDSGIINIPNPGNSIIANNASSATVSLVTTQDAYLYFLNAFSIEIIQPQINLIKIVRDLANNDVGNQTIALGEELFYELNFQNIGNDGATNFTITDQLPLNVTFLPSDLVLPPGVTYTFSGLPSNTITFNIPDNLVTQGGANYQIRIKVKVVESCNDLRDACSNEITNQAYKTYSSLNSGNVVENQQPSASGINSCLIISPGTTNFIADIDDCIYQREEVLCGSSVTLTAGNGYTSYQWHNGSPPTAANAIAGATNQSYTVTATGTYSVVNTAPAPCLSITEIFNVVDFNGVVPNPVIPYADQVDVCPNDGSDLPKIYLCGANDSQLIQTNILNATSIIWEVLDEGSCTAVTNTSCPNTSNTCTWNSAGPNGPNFNAVNAGQYRVTITFQNGCFRTYYFNVYKNLFTPTVTATDIICSTPGTITVNGVPAGYEFSLDNTSGWQSSNFFNNVPAGSHTVYIQQIGGGVGNCIFDVPNIQILDRDFNVDVIVTDPLCNGGQGSIRVQVNNVEPQYTYQLFQGATLVNSAGPINPNDYTFPNLNAGTYRINVSTTDGCSYSETVTITDPPLLTLTAAVTTPLTCEDGEITVYPSGGTLPYVSYEISGTPGFQSLPNFTITTPGTYTFTVTDSNNCTATTSLTINSIPQPVFTISQTNILCYGEATGQIAFNVTNTNGYTLEYSIDNGGNFSTNPIFSNLIAGTYQTIVRYTLGTAVCSTSVQTITITEPAQALTASAGVSELAGCGPSGEGKVRITNPQGGVPGYEYSFDGGSTWVATNEAYLMPGTHTVCIKDSNDCTFCTTVTIDPAPTDPTISVAAPDYNCDGTATTTVTVNNNGGNFAYTYLLNGNLNTPPDNNVFTNVPCGTHEITVQYESLAVPTYSNLLFEDFGEGANTTSPGINPAYCFERQVVATQCNGSIQINDGDYAVTRRINPRFGAWVDARDHTSNGTNPNGRFLCVNIGGTAGVGGILYSKQINDIIPNQPVQASIWAMNLLVIGNTQFNPNLTIQLVKDLGLATETIIASQDTGDVPKTETWQNYILTLNPGANSSLAFVIRSNNTATSGNDVVIDDLNVFQEPISCITEVKYPIHVDCNAAFSAQVTSSTNTSCNGSTDGKIVIAAQNYAPTGYYYSLNGAAGPFNLVTTSPYTITGLGAGTYNLVIAYDLNGTTCSFPITRNIFQPTAVNASAVLTSPATCLNGGVITASATGGTPNYQYQLENNAAAILVPYQANNVFSNLAPGNYIVRVRDAFNCSDPINVAINIPTPTAPTAVVTNASDFCYDGIDAASIGVTTSGGVGPYQYSLNNGVFVNGNFATNHIFTNLTPGNYTIVVRDSYGCTFTMPTVTIAPFFTWDANIIKQLDCSSSPEAIIDFTISGGYPPYTYQVSYNAGPLSSSVNITGNNFNYITSNPGTYIFYVNDANNCRAARETHVTIAPLPVLNPPVLVQTAFNLCNGDSNAAISVTPSGGQGPYVINIVNTTTGNNYGTQTSGLTAGDYTVTVTDANSCTNTANITLSQPDPISFLSPATNIQCGASGTEPGTITVTNVTGGTPPFTYIVSNSTGTFTTSYSAVSSEDHVFNILNFGVYTVKIVDANGCESINSDIRIASPPNSLNIDISAATTDCTAGGTVRVCVNTSVIGGPYYFAIYEDLSPTLPGYPTYPGPEYQAADASDPTGLCSTFINLIPGVTYSFIVYDSGTNCYYFQTAPGPIPTPSVITSTIDPNNVTCTGANDGSVSFTVDGYSGTSVSYQIYVALNAVPFVPVTTGTTTGLTGTPFTVNNFGSLPPGDYFILFTENDGPNTACTQTSAIFTISESAVLLSVNATVVKNDNCNVNAGQIAVTGSNGTPPYSYQIVTAGGPAPTQATWAGQSSNVFNVEGGNYDVYIMDANGCIQSATPVVVPTDSSPNISLALDATTLCNATDGNYIVTVTRDNTVGIAPFTYSVDGAAFTSYTENAAFSFQLTNLNAGTHTVIIRDVNGCTETETITILPPLNNTLLSTLAATLDCGATDGVITVNASGGSGSTNYTYTITPNTGITLTNNVFSNVAAGTYTVTVTDNITNCSINSSITLVQPSAPTFNTAVTDATCNLGSDGTITVNLTGTNTDPVYMYAITSGPVTFVPQSSNVFSGLSAGSYDVQVTSGRNCVTTQTVIVGEATPIVIPTPVVTQFACNAGSNTVNNATIEVNGVTGGSGTYVNYEFLDASNNVLQSGSNNTYTEANVLGGTYTINVYDNNGCFETTTVTINPFISISNPTVTVTTPITCTNTEDITINITTTGGVPTTLNYTVVGIGNPYNVTQTNNPNFSGLTVGNYQITVENATTGCSVQTIHYVFSPNTFVVNATVNNNVTCFGGADGSVSFTFVDQNIVPTNDAGAFNYTIINTVTNAVVSTGSSSDAGPFTVNGLASGTYQLQTTLVGSPFCPAITNFTITQPTTALALATTSTPISCVPGNDGSISAVGSHGWGGPYEYQLVQGAILVDWSSQATFTDLAAGTYTVNVRDIRGCIETSDVTLTIPTPISATVSASTTMLDCIGDTNATITVNGTTGGFGSGYLYTLTNTINNESSGPQTSNIFTNVGAGNYTVSITDSFICSYTTTSVIIDEPTENVQAAINMTVTPTCTTGATIVLSASGGTGPYSYGTTPGGPYPNTFVNNVTFTNVPAGTYSYYVMDANNCFEDFVQIIVEPVIPVSVTVDTTDAMILCSGGTTTITATATNGLGNYVYTLIPNNGAIQNPAGVFTNVPAGTYTVQVTSGDCSSTSTSFTITNPNPLVLVSATSTNITCPNEAVDGNITVIASGGTGTIQYSISSVPNETVNSGVFNNLGVGTYTVYVQDENGCPLAPLTFSITAPPVFDLTLNDVEHEVCLNDNTAFIDFTITGGTTTPTVGYTATNGLTTLTSLNGNFVFTNLAHGSYDFMVTDANGCIFEFSYDFNPGQDIQGNVVIDYACLNDLPNANITVNYNTLIPATDLMFSLDGGADQSSNQFFSLSEGNHFVTITHANTCQQVINFTIDLANELVLTLAGPGTLNTFTMSTTGGQPAYEYQIWNSTGTLLYTGTNTSYLVNQTDVYTVTVTDALGCTDTAQIPMTFYDIEIDNFFTPDGDGTNDGWSPQYLDNFPKAVTYIFDRYSRKIKTLRPGESWDGTYNGNELPSGDYWYVLKLNGETDDREFIGNITLYR